MHRTGQVSVSIAVIIAIFLVPVTLLQAVELFGADTPDDSGTTTECQCDRNGQHGDRGRHARRGKRSRENRTPLHEVIAENAERVVVMYAGRKVEEAVVEELFERPCHPYTKGLLGSIPRLGQAAKIGREPLPPAPPPHRPPAPPSACRIRCWDHGGSMI